MNFDRCWQMYKLMHIELNQNNISYLVWLGTNPEAQHGIQFLHVQRKIQFD